mmetsp:Transcript_32613/g.97326  ORF Transcript_32613/g.97326 Transcript_32613/m.97326 type:complete len:174 (-) Transcript_32613:1070-1591(-)
MVGRQAAACLVMAHHGIHWIHLYKKIENISTKQPQQPAQEMHRVSVASHLHALQCDCTARCCPQKVSAGWLSPHVSHVTSKRCASLNQMSDAVKDSGLTGNWYARMLREQTHSPSSERHVLAPCGNGGAPCSRRASQATLSTPSGFGCCICMSACSRLHGWLLWEPHSACSRM